MPIPSSCPRPTPPGRASHIMLLGHVSWFFLLTGLVMGIGSFMMAQESGHAAAPTALIGASMAVLAMFQDADVLPPEGTPESNHIIKSVIQFQSVFTRGSDPDVQAFLRNALAAQRGSHAQEALSQFRSTGWTSNVLEALSDQWNAATTDQREKLAPGFRQFNINLEDFNSLMELVAKTRVSFDLRGQNIHQVFAQRRREMPGGTQ